MQRNLDTHTSDRYLCTLENNPTDRDMIPIIRRAVRGTGFRAVLKGRLADRQALLGKVRMNPKGEIYPYRDWNGLPGTYHRDYLRRNAPLMFATSFDVYLIPTWNRTGDVYDTIDRVWQHVNRCRMVA
jgi:hypothetical protein